MRRRWKHDRRDQLLLRMLLLNCTDSGLKQSIQYFRHLDPRRVLLHLSAREAGRILHPVLHPVFYINKVLRACSNSHLVVPLVPVKGPKLVLIALNAPPFELDFY